MSSLRRLQSDFPTTEESAVRAVIREPFETLRVTAQLDQADVPTVRVPMRNTLPPEAGLYDMAIPASPRVPFVALRTRSTQRRRWRAEVLEEWVKLGAKDPRCE